MKEFDIISVPVNPLQSGCSLLLSRKRIFWADLIRIIAIAMVIEVHAGDNIVYLWGKAPFKHDAIASWWLTSVTYKSLSSICVPLLFMISGYLLLSSQHDIFIFFKKRIAKILVPLILWSVLYMWWDGAFAESVSFVAGSKMAIRRMLDEPVYFHLWFIYALLGIYLVTPVMRRFVQAASDTELLYFIALWIFTTVALNLLFQLKGISLSLLAQPYVSGFLGYFVAGYFLGKLDFSAKLIWIAAGVFILIFIAKSIWAYSLTVEGGKFDTNLFEYLTWHLIVSSFAGFIALKGLAQYLEKWVSPAIEKIVLTISGATFGIYLIHPKILELLESGALGFHLSTISTHPLLAVPLTVLVTFLISFVVIYLLQRIPLIKLIVP